MNVSPFGKRTYSCFQKEQRSSYTYQYYRSYEYLDINSPFKYFAFKAISVMLRLFLQKLSKARSKDHLRALEGRIDLWKLGKIDEPLFEDETIQQRLKISNAPKCIGQLS